MRRLLLSASLALLFAPVPALAQTETSAQEVLRAPVAIPSISVPLMSCWPKAMPKPPVVI